MISIHVDDQLVLDTLRAVMQRLGDPTPGLMAVGETLAESTKRRFETSTAPDGSRWESNSQTTILNYLGYFKSSFGKSGKISAKGAARAGAKKPLIGETHALSTTITWQLDGYSVLIGSPMIYAGVQQFGAKQGEFSSTPSVPWGDIPARPFLGISDEDREDILDIISAFLSP